MRSHERCSLPRSDMENNIQDRVRSTQTDNRCGICCIDEWLSPVPFGCSNIETVVIAMETKSVKSNEKSIDATAAGV